MSRFIKELSERYEVCRDLPILRREGLDWSGSAICVPSLPGADLVGDGLDIEEVGEEITICLDYSHIHMTWPPLPNNVQEEVWRDPFVMVDAILKERVVATSGWIDGVLRIGTLHEANEIPDLILPKLHQVRTRSWRGTYDRDELLS